MIRNLFFNFLHCGCIGWCFECFFTGLCALKRHDPKLICNTSLWMFPIYGMATFIGPISKLLAGYNILIRGGIYTLGIFAAEYLTGTILTYFHVCPWDYSHATYNISGVIRLDYAPLWFAVGLIYEYILSI